MVRSDRRKLSALSEIARLRADRSISELAKAKSAFDKTRKAIKDIDAEIHATLVTAEDPFSLRLAVEFAALRRRERSELLADLARCELRRKAALGVARWDEGRRIALDRLRDQAS